MKFTLSWLKMHLETEAPLDLIVEKLTDLGLEVEGVEDRSAELAAFRIARVVSAEKHPNADKLRLCMVDTGAGEPVQVVCGAPNAREGIKVVFASPGTKIPESGDVLQIGTIRGVESRGMMCSERELKLSDEHTGIIELPEDAPVGGSFAEYRGIADPVIEIALTPDRADCAGVRGIARDLAAAGLGTLKPLDGSAVPGRFPAPVEVRLETEGCPQFAARLIRGVKNGPSPKWLQDKLIAVGLRPISALVDITNWFSQDQARPLHVFDAAKLKGGIVLRDSAEGDSFLALNEKDYTLPAGLVGIYDGSGLISLGGVMGGESTGVTESTTDVVLEAALFDPVRIAEAGRKLSINSDARYRFERGVDPASVLPAVEQATRMILDLCGGEPSETVVAGAEPAWQRTLHLRPARVAHLGGVDVPEAEQVRILTALGFGVSRTDDGRLACAVPSWRADVHGEADLVEEVLRVHGFAAIPATPLPRDLTTTRPAIDPGQRRTGLVKRALAGRGLLECVTWSFVPAETAGLFGQVGPDLKLLNPISADMAVMRPSILANLIQAAGRNAAKGFPDVGLFEVGAAFRDATDKGQDAVAAGLRAGMAVPRNWAKGERAVDAFDVKADAIAALEAAGAPTANLQVTRDAPDWYHPGRSGVLRLGPTVLARFGELHPAVLEAMDASGPMAAFEVMLDAVPTPKKKGGTAKPLLALSPFQPLDRDFAFLVDEQVEADKLVKAARGADKQLITGVIVFDVYQGAGVEPGKKSVAISVTLQPVDKTLTDAEIEAVAGKIVAAVAKATGATLRG
ncbi:phenylalanine--tRNA ligase subunit beta [Indioceanicola profundi]|uniref:phenylalanine--tRNA ligase subunit beta n=1 Tax=Indioceanicola profundi TaxID=2220096 RepID=UPI000E6AE2F3|nr:phenylalanine--tRNA ligase subunit beta [Indioceanicola profundi]